MKYLKTAAGSSFLQRLFIHSLLTIHIPDDYRHLKDERQFLKDILHHSHQISFSVLSDMAGSLGDSNQVSWFTLKIGISSFQGTH